MERFCVHGTRDTPNPDLLMKTSYRSFPRWRSITATRPLVMNGPDFSGISRLVMSRFFHPQELQFPDDQYTDSLQISDTCISKRTVQIIPGFSLWTYLISLQRECRYPDSRCLDLRYVSLQMDHLDLPGVARLEVSRFSCPRDPRYADG
jgi:hypothetical protein